MTDYITRFTDDDLYKFTMCCAVIENYPRAQVKYRFSDRNNTIYPGFAGAAPPCRLLLECSDHRREEICLRDVAAVGIPCVVLQFSKRIPI